MQDQDGSQIGQAGILPTSNGEKPDKSTDPSTNKDFVFSIIG